VELRPTVSPIEERPSLRPLAFLLGALALVWVLALGLIVAELV
jgi:hypothetical protein